MSVDQVLRSNRPVKFLAPVLFAVMATITLSGCETTPKVDRNFGTAYHSALANQAVSVRADEATVTSREKVGAITAHIENRRKDQDFQDSLKERIEHAQRLLR